ncbi:MAG: hypothetical protein IPI35_30470 [Deltaproteobacteria bacterium]|nr:hypothetical protein [Deltaproteobacteria bacterium]
MRKKLSGVLLRLLELAQDGVMLLFVIPKLKPQPNHDDDQDNNRDEQSDDENFHH